MPVNDPNEKRRTVSSASVMRQANTASVAGLLREKGPLSRAELGRATGLARATVMAIVSSLITEGVVIEDGSRTGSGDAKGGRPGSLLRFNPRSRTVVVCSVRHGRLELTLVDARGRTIAESATEIDMGPDAWFAQADKAIRRLRTSVKDAGPLGAISVLVPGLINRRTGSCMTFAPFGWTDVPVRAALERRFKVPVTVLNPAAAAVLGEIVEGAGSGHEDVVLVLLDKGVGAGLVTGGRLVEGAAGAVGELGHCPVPGSTDRCRCGLIGCLETVASGDVILREARRILGRRRKFPTTIAQLSALHEPAIDAMLADQATTLGLATSWLVNLLNPSMVLLGGTEFAGGAVDFFELYVAAVRRHAVSANHTMLEFGLADSQAHVRGAVHAGLELLPEPIRPHLSLGAQRLGT